MRKISFVLLLSLLFLGAEAQNRSVNLLKNESLEKVLKQAKKEKKLVFLDFGSPQCKPCLFMKKFVFTVDSVADFVNERFVSCDYTEGDEKKRLSKLYNVYSEPVFILLDANGVLMHRTAGQSTSDEMIARFKQGLDPKDNLAAQTKRYEQGDRSPYFVNSYLKTLNIARLPIQQAEVLNNVFPESFDLSQLNDRNYWELFIMYDDSPVSRQSKYIVENKQHFYNLYGEKVVKRKLETTFGGNARTYIFGSKAPANDEKFFEVLDYAQRFDEDISRVWLANLIPAQYKYSDWVQMAKEVDNVLKLNVLIGDAKRMYMRQMSEQLCWYCDDVNALRYAIKWIDLLFPQADEKTAKSITETKASILRKMSND